MTEPEHHHIFELFDPSKYLQSFELDGRDLTLTITRIGGEVIEGEQNRKARKPVVYFKEWKDGRGLVLNKTNAKTLIALYGPDYREWIGKRCTLFPTTTKMAGEEVDCIRIRKQRPSAPAATQRSAKPIAERIATFRERLAACTSAAAVSELSGKASALYTDVDDATRDALKVECEAKANELREQEEAK
jgi:hypothetical protein